MLLHRLAVALKAGDADAVRLLSEEALKKGFSAEQILDDGLLPAMNEIGQKFRNSEIFIPEVILASRAMKAGLHVIQKKFWSGTGLKKKNIRVLIGTVAGDIHDIGKSIVSMYLSAKGCEVINLGIDVPPEEFVASVKKYKPQVLAMSALLTTTMPAMGMTINALKKAGLRHKVKILVGGGPVTKTFAEEIGADGFGYDGKAAAEWVLRL